MLANENTIFHRIIRREIPAEILFEDEQVIAIRDINPASPTHLLIIPKQTIPSMKDVTAADETVLGHMMVVAAELAKREGISESGYRLVINSGLFGQQTVFQLHLHLLGGRQFVWPPG